MNYLNELQKTYVTIIDQQHYEISSAVNEYFCAGDNSPESFTSFIEKLGLLAKDHFTTEEKLMLEWRYESFYSHKQEHDRFLRKIVSYTIENRDSLFVFIRDWLNNHLLMKDIKLGRFLNEQTGRVV